MLSSLHLDIVCEILGEAWATFRRSWGSLLLLSLLEKIPDALKTIAFPVFAIDPLLAIPNLLLGALATGAALKLCDAVHRGKPQAAASISKTLLLGWRPYFKMLGTAALCFLALAISAAFALGCAMSLDWLCLKAGFPLNGIPRLIAFSLAAAPGLALFLWCAIRLCLAFPACILEGWGPLRSLVRSFVMTGGNFWILFEAFLLSIALPAVALMAAAHFIFPAAADFVELGVSILLYAYSFALIYRVYLRLSGEDA